MSKHPAQHKYTGFVYNCNSTVWQISRKEFCRYKMNIAINDLSFFFYHQLIKIIIMINTAKMITQYWGGMIYLEMSKVESISY